MIASNKVMDVLKGIGLNLYERKLWGRASGPRNLQCGGNFPG